MQIRFLKMHLQAPVQERFGVDITTLTYIPNGKIDKYLGNLKFFFIRESTSIRENGGISGFVHSFITEVMDCFFHLRAFSIFRTFSGFRFVFQLLAVVRAHITAIGGNAMVSFYMSELTLLDNPHKNQVHRAFSSSSQFKTMITIRSLKNRSAFNRAKL